MPDQHNLPSSRSECGRKKRTFARSYAPELFRVVQVRDLVASWYNIQRVYFCRALIMSISGGNEIERVDVVRDMS